MTDGDERLTTQCHRVVLLVVMVYGGRERRHKVTMEEREGERLREKGEEELSLR